MNKQASPTNLQKTYQSALKQVRTDLKTVVPTEIAQKSDTTFFDPVENPFWQFEFLGQITNVTYEEGKVCSADSEAELSVYESLIILHYLLTADGTKLSGEWLPFRDLKGGQVYYSNFRKRVNRPLKRVVENSPQDFFSWLEQFPGIQSDFGDNSYILNVLPRIPLIFIYWRGDEEVDSELNVLYDSTALNYLPLEDLVVLAEVVIYRLIKGFTLQLSKTA